MVVTVRHSLLAVSALACLADSVGAQLPVVRKIADPVSCTTCTIEMHPLVTLGDASGPGEITRNPNGVTIDSRGRYWVLAGGPPRVYGPDGKFIQLVGKRGNQPGQFQDPYAAASIPGDSMVVLDPVAGRAVVVSPELRVTREIAAPWPITRLVILQWPALVALSGDIPTAAQVGWPIHIATFAGTQATIQKSFGPDSGKLLVDGRGAIAQLIAAQDDRLWAADFSRYRVTEWRPDGTWLLSLVRDASWFPPSSGPSMGGPKTPPSPAIASVHVDSLGKIWVVAKVAGSRWRQAWPPLPSGVVDVPARTIRMDLLYGSTIEVLDPDSARVIARRSVDEWIVAAIAGNRVAVLSTDAQGIRHLSIVGLALARR